MESVNLRIGVPGQKKIWSFVIFLLKVAEMSGILFQNVVWFY